MCTNTCLMYVTVFYCIDLIHNIYLTLHIFTYNLYTKYSNILRTNSQIIDSCWTNKKTKKPEKNSNVYCIHKQYMCVGWILYISPFVVQNNHHPRDISYLNGHDRHNNTQIKNHLVYTVQKNTYEYNTENWHLWKSFYFKLSSFCIIYV